MAIAAHLEETSTPAGKAREPRRKLRLEAHGSKESGARTSVLVHNISATGLLLESPLTLTIGEKLEIDLPHAGKGWAKVIWGSGNLFGCQFDSPISPAALSAAQLRSPAGQEVEIAPRPVAHSGESFGARLQRLRKERGLTMAQIATQIGVSKPTVWAWEQGKARPVDGRIDALAQILNVTRSELLPEHGSPGLRDVLARSREQIAGELGISPDKVRILIEL